MAELNQLTFWNHIRAFYASWRQAGPYWGGENGVDAMILVNGKTDEDIIYGRWLSTVLYFCGYEMDNTIIVLTKTSVHLLAGPKKCKLFHWQKSKLKKNIKLQ